ncbi:hypothetical protein [Treponema pectinovorum]|nr:hypothetical protein [Treponema pectinovorum]
MDLENIEEGHADGEEKLVFHYNRDARLSRAPEIVQNFYSGKLKAFKPGIFRALVSTKGNRLMFVTLLVCFFIVVFLGFFNKKDNAVLNSIPLNLSAFSFEENVYVSLSFDEIKKNSESKKIAEGQNIQIELAFLDGAKIPVEKKSFSLLYKGEKTFLRTTFHDYDIFYVKASVFIADNSVDLIATIEKR